MKIFCVGRNYVAHAKELGNEVSDEPIVFMKPKSALLQAHTPFYYPEFTNELHYECELVLRISKNGKYIQDRFASKYYDAVTVGIDFTARDWQENARKNGQPWEICKGFDGSAVIGEWVDKGKFLDVQALHFHLDVNGNTVQEGCTSDMLYKIDELVSYISQFFTLKTGDLLYTGTPVGVGPVKINDHLEGWLEERKVMEFNCK
jgi:2-keto-4-pentenoate hydratase/2-oxohepta-3-ene-1,7-dioic acid hydratase in catechol pathway